jgi:hypothetical protein
LRSYIVKTRKVGDCIVVTLPQELLQAEQIGADMLVEITAKKTQKQGSSASKDGCALGPDDPWKLLE